MYSPSIIVFRSGLDQNARACRADRERRTPEPPQQLLARSLSLSLSRTHTQSLTFSSEDLGDMPRGDGNRLKKTPSEHVPYMQA